MKKEHTPGEQETRTPSEMEGTQTIPMPESTGYANERPDWKGIFLHALFQLFVVSLILSGAWTFLTNSSREHCSKAATRLEEASASRADLWPKAWAVNSHQVKDARTVADMIEAVKDAGGIKPEIIKCDASAKWWQLDDTAFGGDALDRKYEELDRAAKAVLASRDAKDLDDARAALGAKKEEASKLLGDSDGKVADNTTREALQKAITLADLAKGKAKDYRDAIGPLQTAIDQVNASMQAKAQADQQAAEQAAQAAAQGAAQPVQQQAAPSYGGGYTPSYRPSYGQGGGGGWSAPAPAVPAPSTPQGNSQSWNDFLNEPDNSMHGCRPDGGCGIG